MSNFMKVNYSKTNKSIIEEYEELKNNPISNCGVTVRLPDKNNIYEWQATILGPKDTFYRGGIFILSIKFPVDYPEHGPDVCFKNPIYHINVNPIKYNIPGTEKLGHICFPNLWKPKNKMREFLTNIFGFFYLADIGNPYGIEILNEYKNKLDLYVEKVKYFTKKYAFPIDDNIKIDYDESWDFSYENK